jgi:hypothetical protein
MMIKSVFFVLGAFLLDSVASEEFCKEFCGTEPCFVPMAISCEQLHEEFYFEGDCCSFVSIPLTNSCRVEVHAGGRCVWIPKSGEECDPATYCNTLFHTNNTDADVCPAGNFPFPENEGDTVIDGLGPLIPDYEGEGSPTPAPSVSNVPTFSPTLMPTRNCAPWTNNQTAPFPTDAPEMDSAAAAWGMRTIVSSLALSTIYTMF